MGITNSKELTNLQIAELLRNVAASYQFKNQNQYRFRIIAYNRAADAIEHATSELKDVWDENKLEEIPGIGPNIARHLDELFRMGRSKHFETVMKGIPQKAFKLMELPGIGLKTALKLLKELSHNEIEKLLKQVDKKNTERRLLLPYALEIAGSIIEWLKKEPKVLRVEPLGSLRRMVSTIGDIDIAVASNEPNVVIAHFARYPKATKIVEKGESSASILLPGDLQVDIRVVKPDVYGSLLQHLTGSKHHNIALREYAIKKGFSLSEYGIKNTRTKKLKKLRTEEEFYKYLWLEWIPPELREDAGEIEASRDAKLPELVELADIKADLQIHSSFNIETSHDLGQSSMEEIVEKTKDKGYEYIAFTEHNPSKSGHSSQEIVEILKRKREKIEQINYSLQNKNKIYTQPGSTPLRPHYAKATRGFAGLKKVFNSLEIDVLPDGKLSVPEEGLATLDFALVSIHSSFKGSREEMTKRVLSALSHPKVKIFAHPTARKLNEREGIELDWPKIFAFCKKYNKWLEINADPVRLDLPDFLVREAVKEGVKLTLGTDAHHKDMMDNMIYGVSVARRGWAKKCDIINTLSLEEFEKEVSK